MKNNSSDTIHIIDNTDPKNPDLHTEKNLYPTVRRIFLNVAILFALSVILFLIYQNGKSIYEHGI